MIVPVAIGQLLSLPPQTAMREASDKFSDSIFRIDGKLQYVKEFNSKDNSIRILDQEGVKTQLIDVQSLQIFLPKSGAYYTTKHTPVILFKKPKRQWCITFKESNYSVIFPDKGVFLTDILEESHREIWVDHTQNIWYFDKIIGKIKNKETIVCLRPEFTQELIDWTNHE